MTTTDSAQGIGSLPGQDGTVFVDGADELDDDALNDDEFDDDEFDELDGYDADDDDVEIELVVLDMAGTTVLDDGLVVRAFDIAVERTGGVAEHERATARQYVLNTMGQSKIEVFRALTEDEDAAQRANAAFEAAYSELIEDFGAEEVDGAEDTIRELLEAGASVAFTTGFAPDTRDAILDSLGWTELADIALSPSDAGRGRPAPDMVLMAMLRTQVSSVDAVAVVGDTRSDMQSGVRAGAGLIVGVLTGAHDEEELLAAGAHVVIESVADLPALLGLRDE